MSSHSEKVDEKIRVFEQAIVNEEIELNPPTIKKIFLAIDSHEKASNVSENATEITLNLAIRFKAEVYIACIAPTEEELAVSEKLVNEVVKLFESKKVPVIGSCGIGSASEHILGLSEKFDPSLIIMQIPYGERVETFDIESIGATVDLVIRNCSFPILLVRKPEFKASDITQNILLLVSKKENIKAAELALSLGAKGSKLKLLSITKKETVEKVENLVQTISRFELGKGVLEHIHKKEVQPLVNKIIDEAKNRGIKVERIHLIGDRIKITLELSKDKHTMMVLSHEIGERNILESEVENLIKLSKIPTLIVKN
ncbi:universal stress protein [Candidatus Bathyarchaeota archaeon]|nr:universal stress protein [Candidatus Bathyarchaeota archaeon]